VSLEEAMANADSPTNLHWLINNATKPAPAAPARSAGAKGSAAPAASRPPAQQEDLSSIKINLDALG
jgi:hypothetical protein